MTTKQKFKDLPTQILQAAIMAGDGVDVEGVLSELRRGNDAGELALTVAMGFLTQKYGPKKISDLIVMGLVFSEVSNILFDEAFPGN